MTDNFTDYIWENFGLIEWGLCLEAIILITAGFFYQVAKFIARTDRHDPLVRFYRVFWRAFFSSVPSFTELQLSQAEAAAMAAGFGRQVSGLDAPDLNALQAATYASSAVSETSELNHQGAPASSPSPAKRGAPPEAQNATAVFDVIIRPLAARDEILGMEGSNVIVAVQCSAEDGNANGTIINLIAPRLGLRPYQISLIRGHYKVLKGFRVAQIDQNALNMRLRELS